MEPQNDSGKKPKDSTSAWEAAMILLNKMRDEGIGPSIKTPTHQDCNLQGGAITKSHGEPKTSDKTPLFTGYNETVQTSNIPSVTVQTSGEKSLMLSVVEFEEVVSGEPVAFGRKESRADTLAEKESTSDLSVKNEICHQETNRQFEASLENEQEANQVDLTKGNSESENKGTPTSFIYFHLSSFILN